MFDIGEGMMLGGWKFKGNSLGAKIIDILSLDWTDFGQASPGPTHLASLWSSHMEQKYRYPAVECELGRVALVFAYLHVRAESEVHHSRTYHATMTTCICGRSVRMMVC
jgi:hypothetical protein